MNREAQILAALSGANLTEQRALVAELGTLRREASARVRTEREIDLSASVAGAHLTPVQPYVRHTAATDWLDEVVVSHEASSVHQAAKAEATSWFRTTAAIVRENEEEFGTQARGYAQVWAGRFGQQSRTAASSFVQQAMHLGGFRMAAEDEEKDEPGWYYTDSSGKEGGPFTDEEKADMDVSGKGYTWRKQSSARTAYYGEGEKDGYRAATPEESQAWMDGAEMDHETDLDGSLRVRNEETMDIPRRASLKTADYAMAYVPNIDDARRREIDREIMGLVGHVSSERFIDGYRFMVAIDDADALRRLLGIEPEIIRIKAGRTASSPPCVGCGGPVEEILPEWGTYQVCNACQAADRQRWLDNQAMSERILEWRRQNPGAGADPEWARYSARTAGGLPLFPDMDAPAGTTWADGFGIWHAIARDEQEAEELLTAEIQARGESDILIGMELVEKVKGGEHWKESERTGSRRRASEGGSTCADCGASIERDPEGEEPRTWHHNDGASHDHEAKPKGGEKEGARKQAWVSDLRWVYVDGGTEYGWFTDEDKAEVEATRQPGATFTWRELTPDEVRSFSGWVGDQMYAQSSRSASRRTANWYCNTHEVYVGDGNRAQHEDCTLEQGKSESKESARHGQASTKTSAFDHWLAYYMGEPHTAEQTGAHGWPLVPSTKYPGENDLVCPECGSADVTMTGHNMGSDMVRGFGITSIRCNSCGHEKREMVNTRAASGHTATEVEWAEDGRPKAKEGIPSVDSQNGTAESGLPDADNQDDTNVGWIKTKGRKTAGTFRVNESVGTSSGAPFFTLQYMGGEDSPGYGVWEDVTSSASRAEIEAFIANPPEWFGDRGAKLGSKRTAASGTVSAGGREFDWGYDYDEEYANVEREDGLVVYLMDPDTGDVLDSLGGITGDFQISDHGNINAGPEMEAYLKETAQEMADNLVMTGSKTAGDKTRWQVGGPWGGEDADSSLVNVEVDTATANTNLGWIGEGDPDAEDEDLFAPSDTPITARRRAASFAPVASVDDGDDIDLWSDAPASGD